MLINGKFRCAGCMKVLNYEFAVCNCGYNNDTDSNDSHCLQVGTVLDNTYVVGKVIGEGGFGITYVGWDRDLEVKVAIKEFFLNGFSSRYSKETSEISANAGDGEELFEVNREKFINEAKVLATFMNEPGIVSVHKFFRENNTAYIVMEFVEGITLKQYLRKKGKLSVDETIGIIGPVMNALAKVHEKNLIHRDISPDNIMITSDGRGKLIDFGAAREANGGNKSLSVVLKHGYAPFEQYQTKGNQGPWTDVYALAATIYKCITGIVPAEATDRMLNDGLVEVYVLEPTCSIAVSDVIIKALNIRVDERYSSVEEFKNALIGALNGQRDTVNSMKNEPTKASGSFDNIKSDDLTRTAIKSGDGQKTTGNLKRDIPKAQNKKKKNIIWIVASIIIVIIGLGVTVFITQKVIPKNYKIAAALMNEENIKNVSIGDTIIMGKYEQDNNLSNGKEDVEWLVLDKKDDSLLVISKKGLDAKQFNGRYESISWEQCSLRNWLNNEFVNETFTDAEKYLISYRHTKKDGKSDKIFLLSISEATSYFESDEDRICKPTEYAMSNGASTGTNGEVWWWLRSPGHDSNYAAFVFRDGSILEYGTHVHSRFGAVRPAFWLDISNL